jgi:hypothetical protein
MRNLPSRFAGIRVIGDVHGEASGFAAAIEDASRLDLFVVQLGDLVDRGPDSPGCLRLAFDLVASGDGTFLLGNHDEKLGRALVPGSKVEIWPDLADTLAAIDAQPDADAFRNQVRAMLSRAPHWLRIGRHFMVHAGFEPAMLDYPGPDAMASRHAAKRSINRALRGQTPDILPGGSAPLDDAGYPIRLYGWIDEVPAGLNVLIGHDVLSTGQIVERRGVLGGRVLFCDTGCGKGGKLSWTDVPRRDL